MKIPFSDFPVISLLLPIASLILFHCNPGRSKGISQEEKWQKIHEKEVVCFVYHRFDEPKYPSTNISSELFEQHLRYLKQHNFTLLTFGKAIAYLRSDEPSSGKKYACITVDDGFQSFYDVALPLLKKYGFKATVFVNTQSVKLPAFMDWPTLRQIKKEGIEIGNHSHSHAFFLDLPHDQQASGFKADLEKSQQLFKQNLGETLNIFAYPYGEFSIEMQQIIKSMGFVAVAAQNSGVMTSQNLYALPRFPVAGNYANLKGFTEKVNMHAMNVKSVVPVNPIIGDKAIPTLQIEIDTSQIDPARIQCFTPGECEINVSGDKITVRSTTAWTSRRALYTLTAPGKTDGKWYWYSHLWIKPKN